jgi:hypothetical protein
MAVLLANSLALSMQSSCSELERVQFGAEESVQQVVAMQGKGCVCVCVWPLWWPCKAREVCVAICGVG